MLRINLGSPIVVGLVALPFLLVGSALRAVPLEGVDDYQALQQWRTSSAFTVPAEGLSLERDTGRWSFDSGTVKLFEPTSGGVVTGLVFEGQGRFTMSVPDPVERANLARLAEDPSTSGFDVAFERVVLRTSETLLEGWLPDDWLAGLGGARFSDDRLAKERHEHWLVKRFADVDARVVVGRHIPGDRYLRIDMETTEHGWLTYQYDRLRREEIRVEKFQGMNEFVEVWVSLDRPEDRRDDGKPSGERDSLLDIEHAEIAIDVTDRTHKGTYGLSDTTEVRAHSLARLRFTPRFEGLTALPLELTTRGEVLSVRTADGRELPFLRDHLGGRSSAIERGIFDNDLVVLLGEALPQGEPTELLVEYEQDFLNFAPGRSWYPGQPDGFDDLHTALIRVTARKKWEVRGIGSLVEKIEGDRDTVTWVWNMEEPSKMMTFSFADRFHEKRFELEGIPAVVSFSPPVSNRAKTMVHNVGADVANSLRFFTWLFDSPLEVEAVQVTGIPSGHGQAFEGFLHMSEFTFFREAAGNAELFRSHEVAHQWWGHEVGWKSYRDQWLSESFAEYSSMMYLESVVDGGKKLYGDVLRAYTDMLLAKRSTDFNRFVRPGLNARDADHRERLGPIGLGYRASTCEMPQGYVLQAYYKGPMVLHMLRHLTRGQVGSDELFIRILRDFIATHRGGEASTEDFQRVIEKHAGGDWTWFFDQWVYGNHIPRYRWSYEIEQGGDGGTILALTVEQSDVPEGFVMPVPVRVEFAGGQGGTIRVNVTQPEETFRLPLPRPAKKVVFNPDYAVLAHTNKG